MGSSRLRLAVSGKGFRYPAADVRFELNAEQLPIHGYGYRDIKALGRLKSGVLNVSLTSKDPYARLDAMAAYDPGSGELEISSEVGHVDLEKLKLSNTPLGLSSSIHCQMSGLNTSEPDRQVRIRDLKIGLDGRVLQVDSLDITPHEVESGRYRIESSHLRGTVGGPIFEFSLLADLLETGLDFQNRIKNIAAHEEPRESTVETASPQELDFELHVQRLDEILAFAGLEEFGGFSGDFLARFEGHGGEDFAFDLRLNFDSLKVAGAPLAVNNTLHVSGSDFDRPQLDFSLTSRHQLWSGEVETKDFSLAGSLTSMILRLDVQLKMEKIDSEMDVGAVFEYLGDRLEGRLEPRLLKTYGESWELNLDHRIEVGKKGFLVKNIEFRKGRQLISLNNPLAERLELWVVTENLNIDEFAIFFPKNVRGRLNANLLVFADSASSATRFTADMIVDDFELEGMHVGDTACELAWTRGSDLLRGDCTVFNQNNPIFLLRGSVFNMESPMLDARADLLDNENLSVLEPLLNGVVVDISGNALGTLYMVGSLSEPMVFGEVSISRGSFHVPYSNTSYEFEGALSLQDYNLEVDQILLRDRLGNPATLTGRVVLGANPRVQLELKTTNLELINTNYGSSKYFYGSVYAGGTLRFLGDVSKVKIEGDLRTQSQTDIYILPGEVPEASRADYISFVSDAQGMEGETGGEDADPRDAGLGLDVDLNVEITRDAYLELSLDAQTKTTLGGSIQGNLNLHFDPEGNLSLKGQVETLHGLYNYNTRLINKDFLIVPGGTIKWSEDPLAGEINLQAVYRQLADPYQWYGDGPDQDKTMQKAYILVTMKWTGTMDDPSLSFQIRIEDEDVASSDSRWEYLIDTINSDPEELRRQVLSLLVLNRFHSYNDNFTWADTEWQSNLSEIVSQQLSSLMSGLYENVEVTIALEDFSKESIRDMQLEVAYNLFDGRLRMSGKNIRRGDFENPKTKSREFLGDWQVEYDLTDNGKVLMKVFKATGAQRIGDPLLRRSGLSLMVNLGRGG